MYTGRWRLGRGRRAWVTGNAEAYFKGKYEERGVGRLTRGGHRLGEIWLGFLPGRDVRAYCSTG